MGHRVMLPLMIPLFLLTPWLTYVVYPPTQKKSPEAPAWAAEELKTLGAITFKEYLNGRTCNCCICSMDIWNRV